MISKKYAIAEINSLSRDDFARIIGPVFEHSPWIAEATWPKRPFADLESLCHTLCQTVKAASQEKQLALIRAHPDLVGRAASKESPVPPTAPLSRSDSAREIGRAHV